MRQFRNVLGAGRHVGGQDVVGVPVEVLARPVVPHGRAWVGVTRGDLNIPEVDTSIKHGRDEGVPQHVWMHPRQPDICGESEPTKPSGGRMPIHSHPAPIQQYRSLVAAADSSFHGSGDGGGSGVRTTLPAVDLQDSVAVLLAEVGDVRSTSFEDP